MSVFDGTSSQNSSQWNYLVSSLVDKNDIVLVDISSGQTAAQQWADLDAYISQDVFVNVKDRKQTLQVTLDVFNLGNMINPKWGRQYYASNGNISLIKYVDKINDPATAGTEETLPTFQFYRPTDDQPFYMDDSGLVSSRWQARIGVRYIF